MSIKFGRLEFSEKKLFLYQKLHNLSRRKVGLPCFEQTWLLNGMEMPWYSVRSFLFPFLFFLFRSNVRARYLWAWFPPLLWYFFLKVLFRKLLYHSYVKVFSQQLRDTLTKKFWRANYGWRFYGHGSRYVLILSTILIWNNMKQRCLEHYHSRKKKETMHFKEHCTKIDISPVVIHFFFSQTKLVFKSNPLFIDILDSFCHSLFTFLPFDFYFYSTDFEVYSMPLCRFCKKTVKFW